MTKFQEEFKHLPLGKKIELFLAAVIAFFAIAQWRTAVTNNEENGRQTDQLIEAGRFSAFAAKENAQAARNFADSAGRISDGIGNAVNKLQAQAAIADEAQQSSARQSESSLAITVDGIRLDQRAWVGMTDVLPGSFSEKAGFPIGVAFFNSGRTPAKNVRFSSAFATSAVPLTRPTDIDLMQLKEGPARSIPPKER